MLGNGLLYAGCRFRFWQAPTCSSVANKRGKAAMPGPRVTQVQFMVLGFMVEGLG